MRLTRTQRASPLPLLPCSPARRRPGAGCRTWPGRRAARWRRRRFEVDPLWPKPLPNHWVLGHDDRHLGRRPGPRLDHPSRRRRRSTCERARARAARSASAAPRAPPVLVFDPAGNLVRSWGGPGAGYEWPAVQPRHPRRLQGQRLDRRQRREGRAHPQVHQGRQVPDAGRASSAPDKRQQRPRELRPRGQDLGRPEDQRGLRRRRLPQQARRRARCRHRQDEALLGRLRQQSRTTPTSASTIRQRRRRSSSATRCTASSAPTTASSTSATGRPTACRCSTPTASS